MSDAGSLSDAGPVHPPADGEGRNPRPSSSSSTGLSLSNGRLCRPRTAGQRGEATGSSPGLVLVCPRSVAVGDTASLTLAGAWCGHGVGAGVAGEACGSVSRGTRVGQVEQTGDSFFPWRTDRPVLGPSSGGTQLSCLCCKPRCSRFLAQSS